MTKLYWYSTYIGYDGWRDVNYVPSGNVVLYPDEGFIIIRNQQENVEFLVSGQVKATPSRILVVPGFNLLPNPFPLPVALGESALKTSGLTGAIFQQDADDIQFISPNGATAVYYYNTDAEGFTDPNFQPADDVVLVPGKAFFIDRKTGSSFLWIIPEPAQPQP